MKSGVCKLSLVGMNRAPAFVAGVLGAINHEPPDQCLEMVTRHHPSDVSPGLWSDVCLAAPHSLEA